MSRSKPNENTPNVASKFLSWQGSEGNFKYFDKSKGENVIVPLPFSFIVLDVLSTVKGWNDAEQLAYWSNEVRNTKEDLITVRSKNGVVMTGLYEQIKEKLSSKGAKYTQSVYVAIKEGKTLVIGNLQLSGSSLTSFIEFAKGKKLNEIGVIVKSAKPMKKGAAKYFEPVYEVMPVSEVTNKIATNLDVELQEYLDGYLAKNASAVATKVDENQENGLNDKSKADAKVKKEVVKEEPDLVLDDSDENEPEPF